MKIRNRKGKVFEISSEEYHAAIVSKGLGWKYDIIEDNVPLEVKTMASLRRISEVKEVKEKKTKNQNND